MDDHDPERSNANRPENGGPAPPDAIRLDDAPARAEAADAPDGVPAAIPVEATGDAPAPPNGQSEDLKIAASPGETAPAATTAKPATNNLALASFILSLAGIQFPPVAVLGIILGVLAMRQLWASPGQGGYNYALAGVLVGSALVGFFIVVIGVFIAIGLGAGGAAVVSELLKM